MYKLAYANEVDDSPGSAREREARALDRSIELFQAAEAAGAGSREAIDAIVFARRLWSILLEDLARDDNALTEELRANLISVGLWVLRECEQIRLGQSEKFSSLIDISQSIRNGLK